MRRRPALIAVAAVVALIATAAPSSVAGGSRGVQATSAHATIAVSKKARARARRARLRRFPNCRALLRYARHHGMRTLGGLGAVPRVGAPTPTPLQRGGPTREAGAPMAQPVAAPQADDSSRTNVQEVDVDEPDIVKTDGQTIFALAGRRLNAVDARSAAPRVLGSLDLGEGAFSSVMLIHASRALVISRTAYPVPVVLASPGNAVAASAPYPQPTSTTLTEVDIADPAAMRILRTEKVEGDYVDARLNGDTARVVISSYPPLFSQGAGEDRVRSRIRNSTASSWIPRATVASRISGRHSKRRITACRAVRRPASFSGLGMVTVLTIDMSKGLPAVDSDSLMTDAQTVYASQRSLYVATQRYVREPVNDAPLPPLSTAIHRFDISDAGKTDYLASGIVDGLLLNQWSLSEYKGDLRVASTDEPIWFDGRQRGTSQSSLTVLRRDGGALVPIGRVGGLGKGQRIYAVRFIEDAGFVVTFRRIDPLYTLDVSNPAEPRVRGELEIQGYSAYLHPVGKDLLLGIGKDADSQGAIQGTQLSLFDVSDLGHPKRVARHPIGANSYTPVENDHHAFLYWAPAQLAMLPTSIYGSEQQYFEGAIGFRVKRDGIAEVGRIKHTAGQTVAPIGRSVVVGDRVFTVSGLGVKASALDTLDERGWVEFPG
jgi:Beta propeller domain